MILLMMFLAYMLKYKNMESLIDLIKRYLGEDYKSLLFYDESKRQNESVKLKKYVFICIGLSLIIDFTIIAFSQKYHFIFINSLTLPLLIIGIYRMELKSDFDKAFNKIHMELPVVLQKIYCLISIDYSIEDSIYEALEDIRQEQLINEFRDTYNLLSRGYDLCYALDYFFEGLNSQYIMRFKSVLISHYYYGGTSSKENFIALIYDLLEYRVLVLKEDGEKIKVKLIIPIIIIFASTILSLALPIVLNLSI